MVVFALTVWASGLGSTALLDDPRRRFLPFLAGALAAGAAWAALVAWVRADVLPRSLLLVTVALGAGARALFLVLPPAFSEDVFRYIYEGRLVWAMGPGFAFMHPPADALLDGVPPALLDEAWLRINHAHVPTIYPPAAQACFALADLLSRLGLSSLVALKLLLVLVDLGVVALLARGRGLGAAAIYAACPLAVLEIAREGHADGLAVLGLAVGALGFLADAPRRGFAGFALAALGKLNGLIGFAAALFTTRRGVALGLGLLSLLLLPVFFAGGAALTGAGTYAGAWRAGDGAFSLLLAGAEQILGGDWRAFGPFTVTRHQLARGLAAALFLASSAVILRRRADEPEIAGRVGLLLLLLLLLSPTVHPWYGTWLLPFIALGTPSLAAPVALVALAPLLHHPGWLELVSGRWQDLPALRALVHGPVWVLLTRDLARRWAFR